MILLRLGEVIMHRDPTSVILVNHKKFLITAESDGAWLGLYITKVYEIIE